MTDSLTRFQQLLTDAWDSRMQRDPLYATLCGDRRYNDRLPPARGQKGDRRRPAPGLSRCPGAPGGHPAR